MGREERTFPFDFLLEFLSSGEFYMTASGKKLGSSAAVIAAHPIYQGTGGRKYNGYSAVFALR